MPSHSRLARALGLLLLGCGSARRPATGVTTRPPRTTDEAGRFTIEDVPATYDAFVSDEDGSWVSLYRGMSRRDPQFCHQALDYKAMGRHQHTAPLFVKVEGGTPR